jgi:hypothetical protein
MAAAESAGKISKRTNMYDKLTKWDLLTPKQTEEFRKLAKEFITNKWKSYDRLYNNMKNAYTQFWISDKLLPLSATEQLKNTTSWSSNWTTYWGRWKIRFEVDEKYDLR